MPETVDWDQSEGSYMEDICQNTDNPLYTDTRCNNKIHYNDNLTVTKPWLKR